MIAGVTTQGNQVIGNFIGTDVSGLVGLGNRDGVLITRGAHNNTIGGASTSQVNLISGNSGEGVRIDGEDTTANTVRGNQIGPDGAAVNALPNGNGVGVHNGAHGNVIAANLISGNRDSGILLADAGTSGNLVIGNKIGTNALGGTFSIPGVIGVSIRNGASRAHSRGTSSRHSPE